MSKKILFFFVFLIISFSLSSGCLDDSESKVSIITVTEFNQIRISWKNGDYRFSQYSPGDYVQIKGSIESIETEYQVNASYYLTFIKLYGWDSPKGLPFEGDLSNDYHVNQAIRFELKVIKADVDNDGQDEEDFRELYYLLRDGKPLSPSNIVK